MTDRAPIERRWAMRDLRKQTGDPAAAGKYVVFSNNLHQAYVLSRYEETGDLSVQQDDGTWRPVQGNFWRVFLIRPESGLLSYEDEPGRSPIRGIIDAVDLIDAAIEHDEKRLIEVASHLRRRHDAIQTALRRYSARRHRKNHADDPDVWAVYDRVTPAWPAYVDGQMIPSGPDPAIVEAAADWLNREHG